MREEQDRKLPAITRLHNILGKMKSFVKITNMYIFSENEQLENIEGKCVTNNGYSAVEDSPLLTSKETLITLDYVNTVL